MSTKSKTTLQERERKLHEKIEHTRQMLASLQQRRKAEIANLVYKHGLDQYDNDQLEQGFAKLAKEYNHGYT